MKDAIVGSVFFGIILTVITFYIGDLLKRKLKHPLANPILISGMAVIGILVFFDIDFDTYNKGAKYIGFLLTPATVCLAIPLYEEIQHLKNNWLAIMSGIISGIISSAATVFVLSLVFKLGHQEYVTLLPKSITAAIGMDISKQLDGVVSITVAIIIITGLIGNIMGEFILEKFNIKHPIAKGVAYGASSHALGTSKAMEIGELEGAISGLSLAVSGILTVFAVSIFANLI
ncbi:LrgB family protein [Peptostreptococcus anaerobius]|uniref:LrgB family protein n=2 Tax=Peptostreptococcus porci TaxID=2652282 RepID=A0A6N7WZG6_9FIRM|nr:LrgB family protein [Peptostreptococcus porci]MDD7182055.1 LrgB family protein [Peptostreptococcus porci]MDY4127315.1 LrgB family protein [Peptostreptococcus porci]MDY5435603.1 LrgB family protein [Peptostreptococcus porci]MDY5965020.1 LrgB family protein [Peptostreptococcus porci]MDY6231360.1 LrgB family protein [Peptostreptococcus porci]